MIVNAEILLKNPEMIVDVFSCGNKIMSDLPTEYRVLKKVGSGTFGVVYKVINNVTTEVRALKIARRDVYGFDDPDVDTSISLRDLQKEVYVLRLLGSHVNIISLTGVSQFRNNFYMEFEYVKLTLTEFLENNDDFLDDGGDKVLIKQLMLALSWCHSHDVLHGDIKPDNIMITEDMTLKLIDFGSSRIFKGSIINDEIVTLWYRPPEVLMRARMITKSVDIWSAGCTMAQIASGGNILFEGDCEIDQMYKIAMLLGTPNEITWPRCTSLRGYPAGFPQWSRKDLSKCSELGNLDKNGIDLFSRMVRYAPGTRISAYESLEHPYFLDKY